MPYLESGSSAPRLHCEHESECPFAGSCTTLEQAEILPWNGLLALMRSQDETIIKVGLGQYGDAVYGTQVRCNESGCTVLIAAEPFSPDRSSSLEFSVFLQAHALIQQVFPKNNEEFTFPESQAAD